MELEIYCAGIKAVCTLQMSLISGLFQTVSQHIYTVHVKE